VKRELEKYVCEHDKMTKICAQGITRKYDEVSIGKGLRMKCHLIEHLYPYMSSDTETPESRVIRVPK